MEPELLLCMQVGSAFSFDVLQAHLSAGDQLLVLWAADLDLPELLGSSLLDRDREQLQPARAVGAEEVRSVRDPDSLLAAMVDRLERAGGREGLDYGCVETAVDDSPGLMVAFVGGD